MAKKRGGKRHVAPQPRPHKPPLDRSWLDPFYRDAKWLFGEVKKTFVTPSPSKPGVRYQKPKR